MLFSYLHSKIIVMDSRVRASPEQLLKLLEYMESHHDLSRTPTGLQGRVRSERLWAHLTNILNAVGGGVSKTTEKWKKVWADLKSKTKKKALTLRRHASVAAGGSEGRRTLSAFDKRMLAIIGPLRREGQASVDEMRLNRSSVPSELSSSDVETKIPLHIEIKSEVPSEESPLYPTFTLQELRNRRLASTTQNGAPELTPSPRPLVVTPTSSQASPASATSQRRRQTTRSLASSPVKRRLRSTTTATPQSVAATRRPGMRIRRRYIPTPFVRLAREFANMELYRLELEETRARQQHEREMRALEVEHERNLVFSSLVNVAQAWLDHYRSRDNTIG